MGVLSCVKIQYDHEVNWEALGLKGGMTLTKVFTLWW